MQVRGWKSSELYLQESGNMEGVNMEMKIFRTSFGVLQEFNEFSMSVARS